MIKTNKLLRLISIAALLMSFARMVFADNSNEGVISRPVIEYSSGDLRDPFNDLFYLEKEKEKQSVQVPQESIPDEPMFSLENFKVQGVIWGGKFPQAIINNKVLKVGDLIEGAEIVSIEKEGITLNFSGRLANLVVSGNTPIAKESK
jgi:hypothetical protein